MTVVVAPCQYKAAKYAVMNFHYSKAMPKGRLVHYGVWHNDDFIGAIIFGGGATPHLHKQYNIFRTQCCELVRIALKEHDFFVSQVLAKAIRLLKIHNQHLRLIVSFADPRQNHIGRIYQATNWIYSGKTTNDRVYKVDDEVMHPRTMSRKRKQLQTQGKKIEIIKTPGKHKYLYPLDKAMRRQLQQIALPYPQLSDMVIDPFVKNDNSSHPVLFEDFD